MTVRKTFKDGDVAIVCKHRAQIEEAHTMREEFLVKVGKLIPRTLLVDLASSIVRRAAGVVHRVRWKQFSGGAAPNCSST